MGKGDIQAGQIYSDGNIDLIVYPNPSSGTFSFRLETTSDELITINIFDMMGRLISSKSTSNNYEAITIGEDLADGTYISEVMQGDYRKTVKIVKVQ